MKNSHTTRFHEIDPRISNSVQGACEAQQRNEDWVAIKKPPRTAHPDLQHLINRKGCFLTGYRRQSTDAD